MRHMLSTRLVRVLRHTICKGARRYASRVVSSGGVVREGVRGSQQLGLSMMSCMVTVWSQQCRIYTPCCSILRWR